MQKIVITDRPVWVGGIVRTPGETLDVANNVANEMCGALGTARLYVEALDAPAIVEPKSVPEPEPEPEPEGKNKKARK